MILKRLAWMMLFLGLCTITHAITDGTELKYEMIRKEGDGKNIELSYPKFQEEWLNEMIEKPLLQIYNEHATSDLYQDESFYYGLESDILGRHNSIVTIRFIEQEFAGGAHEIVATNLQNIDLSSQKKVTFDDLFTSKSVKEAMLMLGKKHFKARYVKEIEEDLINFDEGFYLGNQYGFTDEGLIFIYGANSIGPSYLGEVQFTIPYAELERVIPENISISPFIKEKDPVIFTDGSIDKD